MAATALKAFEDACSTPQMIKCGRCKGVGYHHGYGEDGASPDWCEVCGGAGYEVMPGEELRAMRLALLSALQASEACGSSTPSPSEEEMAGCGGMK